MKKTKRKFAAAVAAVLGLAFLTACGGADMRATGGGQPSQSASGAAGAAGAQGENVKLRFATLGTGSSWYVYGATIADVVSRSDPGLQFDVLPYSGGIGNVLLQAQDKTDISISSNITNTWAKEGTMAFEETGPNPELRCITGMLDQMYVAVAVRNGSGIENLRDIADQKLPIRMFTSEMGQTSEYTAQVVLDSIGCSYEDLISWGGKVEHTDFASIVNAAKDGKADLIIQQISAGHASFTELLLTADFRFCPLDEESRQFMKENGYALTVMPADTFPNQSEDIPTAGVNTTVNCNASLPEETAYRIAKGIYEHPEELATGHKALADFDLLLAADVEYNGGLPIHPGALRYYKEIGLVKE